MEEKIKTIAIFMGLFQDDKGFWGFDYTPNHLRCHSDRIKDIYQYDRDWNQLMEVVEKIENLGMSTRDFTVKISYDICSIDFTDHNKRNDIPLIFKRSVNQRNKIEAVYEAVVKFINFYNKQKEE
jgi:hypothetical protein